LFQTCKTTDFEVYGGRTKTLLGYKPNALTHCAGSLFRSW